MITFSTLYKDKESFIDFVNSQNIDTTKHSFIRVFTAIYTPLESLSMINVIKDVLPNSSLIGGSCSGVIFKGEAFDTETLVIIEQFDNVKIQINTYKFKNKQPKYIANEINKSIDRLNVPLMHILCSDLYEDINELVNHFNSMNNKTRLVGGILGEVLPKDLAPYAFTEKGIIKNGIVTASLISNELYLITEINVSTEPISQVYNLNKTEDCSLIEIENVPAIEWCKDQFGLEDLKTYTDWQATVENDTLVRFPLILERHSSKNISRFIKYDAVSKNITLYCSKLEDNTLFRIGYINPIKSVQDMYKICNIIKKRPIESLFFYSCLFRKLYLSGSALWEISPFGKDVCGIFMMGEISYVNDRNEYLNGSCCFLGIAEDKRKHNINVDFSVFNELYKIKDDHEKVLNMVLRKQSNAITERNKQLLEQIIVHQELTKQSMYIDQYLGIDNSIKFLHEKDERNFNKLCMIQLENSELLMSRIGKEFYYDLMKYVVTSLSNFIDNYVAYTNNYQIYCLNDNTIFLAVGKSINDNKFDAFINTIYENFQFIKIPNRDELMIFRFAIVSNQEDLLECGLETLQRCKSLQTYFLIYDVLNNEDVAFDNEMEVIHLLNEVVKNKWVVPYFQGIYNNKTKTITKYESLMRIRDKDNKIYSPYHFMDVAKKYNIYPALSKIMISKVLEIFKDKNTNVSINFSASDINSESFQNAVFRELSQIKDCSKFTFEILEDENFRDLEMLNIFIERARGHKVKIAIDDFGTGYSNFMKIAKISPDFIKIDGSIIKNIDSNDTNRKILNTIVFLGNQLGSELIAEFVENQDVQDIIEELGIYFSQGYYFAKPEPYENIKDKLN